MGDHELMKKIIAGIIAATLVLTAAACGKAESKPAETTAAKQETAAEAKTESKADTNAENKAAETKAAEAPAAATETAKDGSESQGAEAQVTTKVYEKDGWKVEYIESLFNVEEKDGEVHFVYTEKTSGKDEIVISNHPEKLPSEVLYDKTGHLENGTPENPTVIRGEGYFGNTYPNWTFSRTVMASEDGKEPYRSWTGIEHNGGTVLVATTIYAEKDEELWERVGDNMSGLLDTFTFTNHKPQQQFEGLDGTYVREYTEEIEGKKEKFTDTLVLNSDHSGKISLQDDIDLIWSSWELILDDGSRYEYTQQGDTILVNFDGDWFSFEKKVQ